MKGEESYRMRLAYLVVVLLVVIGLQAWACAKPAQASEVRKPQGTLTIAQASFGSESWAPYLGGVSEWAALPGVYEFLLFKDEDRNLAPGLAERWEVSRDGLSWTFHLRRGVQWHDGWGEFTAEDVKWSIEALQSPKSRASYRGYLRQNIKSVEVVDRYTVRINTNTPVFDIPDTFSTPQPWCPIGCKAYFERAGEEAANRHPIGTGPYKFVEHKSAQYVKLEAVENHWRQVPYFKTVINRNVPEEGTRIAMLRTGEIDMAYMGLQSKAELQAVKDVRIKRIEATSALRMILQGLYLPTKPEFNPRVPWVANPADPKGEEKALKVRKALNLAINQKELIDNVLYGEALTSAVWYFWPWQPFYDSAWKPYPYDPKQAKQLLAEAGYPNGFSVTMHSIIQGAAPELPAIVEAVAMYWEKIGIKVNIKKSEYVQVYAAANKRQLTGEVWPQSNGYMDEPAQYAAFAGLSNLAVQGWVESLWLDEKVNKAMAEMDPKKRYTIEREIGQWIYDNYWFVPIGLRNALWAVGPRVNVDFPVVKAWHTDVRTEYITPSNVPAVPRFFPSK